MNRVSLQSFSAGIIFTTAIFAGFYYGNHSNEDVKPTISDAKKMLESQGYSVSKSSIKNDSEKVKKTLATKQIQKDTTETQTKQKDKKQEKVVSYILKIKNNMSTSEISDQLEKEKIIDDSVKFQTYMNKKNLSRQVQIGEYIVSNNMSYEELGQLVTK